MLYGLLEHPQKPRYDLVPARHRCFDGGSLELSVEC
jgi:hypothetical protein